MARVENTVFISYRRKDISWALAVYQYLTSQKYDVFFDYSSIPSGDFEQIIISNIRARAHFLLILTPTALDRCNEPGDWLRREIETAVDEKRNIIPLFFDDFNFGSPSVVEKLTGKLGMIKRYNGLDIPSGYFIEAMERLRVRYLNAPLNAVIHPVPIGVRKVVEEEQNAADLALLQKREIIEEIVRPVEEKQTKSLLTVGRGIKIDVQKRYFVRFGIGAGTLLIIALGVYGVGLRGQDIGAKETAILTNPTLTEVAATPTLVSSPESGGDNTMNPARDGMVLVHVTAGDFLMGSEGGNDEERPVHLVTLDDFWIDQTEVTNDMYRMCVQDGDCDQPSDASYYSNGEYGNSPVVYVSWNDAAAYCSWAGRRLPTEAEWEKTASWDEEAQTKNVYPWGEDIDCSVANYQDGDQYCIGDPSGVGSYPTGESPYGALDMAGNVWEWVYDWYDTTYYDRSPTSNPPGPDSGEYRVLRGGSWSNTDYYVRTVYRGWYPPSVTDSDVGFRCAVSE